MATQTSKLQEPKQRLTFTQVLESEHRHLVEAIEWGCSDKEIIKNLITDLYNETGYIYIQ